MLRKKVLSLILATSMVLGSFSMAFAAPTTGFEDVADSNVAKAVERLKAFGIVDGYEDGTYKPENDVTREEFAKLLVTALGMENAANAVATTGFADVEAGRWSAGFVTVAAGQGLIKGYPDGTFKPAAKVSYSEAVTMLVRALGYKDEFLPGTWPGNFIAKAAEAGVSSNVKFTNAAGLANRGDVALLVNNTLDSDVVKVSTYEGSVIKYEESKSTFLEEKLEIYNLEEAIVVGTARVDKGIDKDQVKVEYTKDLEFNNRDYRKGDSDSFDVLDTVETDNLLGLSLNVYIDSNDEVVFAEESRRAFTVLYDVVDEGEDIEEDSITLINADKEYELEMNRDRGDYKIYIDNKDVNFATFQKEAEKGNLFVKAVLSNKGNIKLIDAHKFDGDLARVVTKADEDEIVYFVSDSDDEYKVKAKDYDKVVVFDMDGNAMNMEDIKKDDVIYVNNQNLDNKDLEEASSKDEVAYILVVRDVLEGNAEAYRGLTSFEVDGKFHDVNDAATVSIDEDKTIKLYSDAEGKELDDITGEEAEVTVLKDFVGDVRHIRTGIKSSSNDIFGVITGVDTRYTDIYVKVLNYDEKTVEYELDLDDAYGYDNGKTKSDDIADALKARGVLGKTVNEGDIVRYTLNKNGDINEIELLASIDAAGEFTAATGTHSKDYKPEIKDVTASHDIAKRSIKFDGKYNNVKDDVVVFNYTPALDGKNLKDAADVEVAEWNEIVGKNVDKDTRILVVNDTDRAAAELVVFLSNFDSIGNDAFTGYVTNIMTKDGDKFAEIAVAGSDKVVRYELNKSSDYNEEEAFERRNIAVFVEKSNGKVEAELTHEDFEVHTGEVTAIKGRYVTLNNGVTVRVASDAVIYEKGNKKTYSDIDKGDYVRLVEEEGMITVVKRYDVKEADVEKATSSEAKLFLRDYKIDTGNDWNTGKPGTDLGEFSVTAEVYNNRTETPDFKVDFAGFGEVEEAYVDLYEGSTFHATKSVKAAYFTEESPNHTVLFETLDSGEYTVKVVVKGEVVYEKTLSVLNTKTK